MTLLIALLLAVPSPTPSAPKIYVGPDLRNQGVSLGTVNAINCSGAGITCTRDGGVGTLRVTASTSDAGGSSLVLPLCDAGYVLTSDGGSLSCTSTILSALAAQPGAPVGSIQYNGDAGGFGGVTQVITADGAHLTILPDTAVANAPSAGRTTQDIMWTAGMPEVPSEIDSFFGVPNWSGMTPPYSGLGTQGSWQLVCHTPDQYGGGNLSTLYGTQTVLQPFTSTTGFTFDAGSIMGRMRWAVGATSGSGPNIWSTMRETLGSMWGGALSGSGGFKAWERIATLTETSLLDGGNPDSASYMFAGWTLCGISLTGTSDSSAFHDTVYFGCDSADTNIHACSNDETGSATCTDLGANFPCRSGSRGLTGPYGYDAFFYESPTHGSIGYFIHGIDRNVSATGTLTDLPNPAQGYLCYYAARNSGHDAGSGSSGSMGIGGECVWQHL